MKIIFALIFIILTIACGTELDSPDSEIIAPPGSTITVIPESRESNIGGPLTFYNITYSVTVKSPDNRPVGRAKLLIQYPWAHPVTSYFYFYDGKCPSSGLPSELRPSPFEAVTDDYGVYYFCVRYAGGQIGTDPSGNPIYLEYKGDIEVFSGTNVGKSFFSVSGP